VENSIGVLKLIAEHLSINLHISLMSQYYPPDNLQAKNRKSQIANRTFLHRTVSRQEYQNIIESFHDLGFSHGWLQDYQSHKNYRPDFSRDHPFE
jgi:putative pyruvate formate lyase activating enzyme